MEYYFDNCFGLTRYYVKTTDVTFIVGSPHTGKTQLLNGLTTANTDVYIALTDLNNVRKSAMIGLIFNKQNWVFPITEKGFIVYNDKTLWVIDRGHGWYKKYENISLKGVLPDKFIRKFNYSGLNILGTLYISHIAGRRYRDFIEGVICKGADPKDIAVFYRESGINPDINGEVQKTIALLQEHDVVSLRNPEAYLDIRGQEQFGKLIHKIASRGKSRIVIETNSDVIIDSYGKRKGTILYCSKGNLPKVINICATGGYEGSALIDWRAPYLDYAIRQLSK